LLRLPPLQASVEGIDRAKGQLSRRVDIGDGRLQLQKILPRSSFVRLGIRFVAHAGDNSPKISRDKNCVGSRSVGSKGRKRDPTLQRRFRRVLRPRRGRWTVGRRFIAGVPRSVEKFLRNELDRTCRLLEPGTIAGAGV